MYLVQTDSFSEGTDMAYTDTQIKDYVTQNAANPGAISKAMQQYGVNIGQVQKAGGWTDDQVGKYVADSKDQYLQGAWDNRDKTNGMLGQWYADFMKNAPKPNTYTPEKATVTPWTVDKNQTVQGQVADITKAGGPLMEMAEARSRERANASGMLNSSMAVTAGQRALYEAALPIAQQDANTYAQSGQFNAGSTNRASEVNAGFANDAGRFNAGAANDLQGLQFKAATDFGLQQIKNDFEMKLQTLSEGGMDRRQAAQLAMQESLAKLNEAGVTNRFDQQLAMQSRQFDFEQTAIDRRLVTQHQNELARLGFVNELNKANVPSQVAAQVSMTMMQNVNAVLGDPNLTAEEKRNAVQNIIDFTNSQLAWQSKFYGVLYPTITAPTPAAPAPGDPSAPTTPTTPATAAPIDPETGRPFTDVMEPAIGVSDGA